MSMNLDKPLRDVTFDECLIRAAELRKNVNIDDKPVMFVATQELATKLASRCPAFAAAFIVPDDGGGCKTVVLFSGNTQTTLGLATTLHEAAKDRAQLVMTLLDDMGDAYNGSAVPPGFEPNEDDDEPDTERHSPA